MKRLLAVIRRVLMAGTVSLIIGIFIAEKNPNTILQIVLTRDSYSVLNIFCIYLVVAPILYVVFNIISCAYIRHNGQFAEVHKSEPFIVNVFRAIWSDLTSPLRNIDSFLTALTNRYPEAIPKKMIRKSRFISIIRFIGLVILFLFCLTGLVQLKLYIS